MPGIISGESKQRKEQQEITIDEKLILQKIRNKKLFYIISSYLTLAGVLINAWGKDWLDIILFRDIEINRFGKLAPYFMLFLFLLLTFFYQLFFESSISLYKRSESQEKRDYILCYR